MPLRNSDCWLRWRFLPEDRGGEKRDDEPDGEGFDEGHRHIEERILVQLYYPKISFTLSKIEDPRSAGLFSTFNDAPNCSSNFRCSRVSFVGVSTRT